ncbi:ABC transporter ATP-binding protein [Arachnia propionica]|uniref:ABC transporter ATP-binding protein n=1 Tax=Arachnia propionica TaxID=1750 RepID=A0A3P1WVY0_9ACTN|nr:ABC transporter ATP-binding protein [Arachnia propionica]RRD48533.1 ABC transporter ATP-binding protein [Arachnia propionica]
MNHALDRDAAITLTDVSKEFRDETGNQVLAVDDVSLTIHPGEVVAILGPNGAGKTTTIDMILGLTRPDRGRVELFGNSPLREVQSGRAAAVLQTGGLLPELTVVETLSMIGSLFDPSRVEECMRRARLLPIAHRQVSKCSGGEQQRVRFGLALLSDPDLLILDEPTAGMDVEARHAFWEEVRADAERGRTILFATHYLEEADGFADRIILMNHGRVIADDTSDAIRASANGRIVSAFVSPEAEARLLTIPDVQCTGRRGERISLHHPRSDQLAQTVLDLGGTELEVVPRSLEDAFLTLTSEER